MESLKERKCSVTLTPKVITSVRTQLGYMQVLEYILQDCSFLHVVQWHFNNDLEKDMLVPRVYNEIFYRSKDSAMEFARKLGDNLLEQEIIKR